jgi:hypothetical protein
MSKVMQAKDIDDKAILEYLYDKQGEWTCLWMGHFKDKDPSATDVYYAMPENTPHKVALAKMKSLHKRGLVGGCPCGCRGDFEITDKGLELLGKPRLKPYNGY